MEARKVQITPKFKEKPFKVLANMKSGLLVVHLQIVEVVVHVVVVDAGRRLIFDNAEFSDSCDYGSTPLLRWSETNLPGGYNCNTHSSSWCRIFQ